MQQPDFSDFPLLQTGRLVLRRLLLSDAEEIFLLRSDAKVAELTGKRPFVKVAEAIAYIDKIDKLIAKNECIFWAISIQGEQVLIGAICLWNFDVAKGVVEIGYELLDSFQGRGIMAEAIACIIQYAFDIMGVHTITAFPSGENPSSVRLLEKLGFCPAQYHFENTHTNVPGMLTYTFSRPK
jgi:ribosomal-protein-alanine N-acetyltransferase